MPRRKKPKQFVRETRKETWPLYSLQSLCPSKFVNVVSNIVKGKFFLSGPTRDIRDVDDVEEFVRAIDRQVASRVYKLKYLSSKILSEEMEQEEEDDDKYVLEGAEGIGGAE